MIYCSGPKPSEVKYILANCDWLSLHEF